VVYPGTCRARRLVGAAIPAGREAGAAAGQAAEFAVRLRLADESVHYIDRLAGPRSVVLAEEVGDQIVLRRDGLWAYQFACAVDDGLSGVTQVVRGGDLLPSTAPQIAIQRAAGLRPPDEWIHLPLMTEAATGKRLAKRDGATSIAAWREGEGVSPAEARGRFAASLGLIERAVPVSLEELLPAWREWLRQNACVHGRAPES
jgi:glutamyl-tRNA synthetase